jgi:hypothetical protein
MFFDVLFIDGWLYILKGFHVIFKADIGSL